MTLFGKQFISVFILITLLLSLSHAAERTIKLTKNPFNRPPIFNTSKNTLSYTSSNGPGAELDVRATMSAGEKSLVNIGGNIIRVGEEIRGYRLLSVEEDKILFLKNNSIVTVIIKPEELVN